ncbi:MAG: efflux RND transporter periplasmic adaptor subunit [Planctomycetes bacterium]|nr:efflux RND transporter periplasmic adaptor subunit [Planctomycetota bacterium]
MIASPRGALALFLVGVVLLPMSLACSGSTPQAAKKEEGLKKREPTRVRVAAVERREMKRILSTTTTVESEQEVKVFSRVNGTVSKLLVEEGSLVQLGDVLAELDARDRETQLEEARVAVREAEDAIAKAAIAEREATARVEGLRLAMEQATRDYERNEKANLISQSSLDGLRLARDTKVSDFETSRLAIERTLVESKAAKTALEKAKLALRSRELEFSYTRICAPFAGVVAERLIRVGDAVGAGGHAFVLTDLSRLRAVLFRPQREFELFVGAAAAGKAIEIQARAEALPNLTFQGEIQRVSPSIDPRSGSFRVTVLLKPDGSGSPARQLLPGMLVRVDVVTDRHPDALVVPKRALRREGEVNLLFVARDGRARRVEVEEGYSEDVLVEVLPRSGTLAPGDQVIVVGNRELEDGGEIELETEPEPKNAAPNAASLAPSVSPPPANAPKPDAGTQSAATDGASEPAQGAQPAGDAAPAATTTSQPKQG